MTRPSPWSVGPQSITPRLISIQQTSPMSRSILSTILSAFTSACLLASCTDSGNTASAAADSPSPEDTAALRIALLPVEECAPLRYAQETGLAQRMGLDMRLMAYDAMMDMDTAVTSDVAHVYFEDIMRMDLIKADSLRPVMLLPVPVKLSLMANKDKGVDSLPMLRTHMVGLTRISVLEHWMNELVDTAHLEQDEVYHAQINSIPLRFRMVADGLIDAAIMPRPWSDSLAVLGHGVIREEILDGMGFFISTGARNDSIRMRQADLLKKVYLEALKQTTE